MRTSLDDLLRCKAAKIPANEKLLAQLARPRAEVSPGKYEATASSWPMESPKPRQVGSGSKLNKTEEAYLSWLNTMADTRIWVQSIGLKLSRKAFYYPDFAALDKDGLRFIDTKGVWKGETQPHCEDDFLVKIKWAAQLYAPCRFLMAWRGQDGAWKHKLIAPS